VSTVDFLQKSGKGERLKGKGIDFSFSLPLAKVSFARDSMSGAHKEQLKYLFPVPRSLFLRQV